MNKYLLVLLCIFTISTMSSQDADLEKLMSQDWPNLKKYRAENKSLQNQNSAGRVVFMGNSITEGWGNQRPDFFKENNYINRGIGGQTTPQMLVRFTPDVVDLKPEAVVILAGTNDIAGNTGFSSIKMITDNLKAMAQLATANGIKVILCSVLPVYQYPWRKSIDPIDQIAEINSWMKDFARANEYTYVDYFAHMADEEKGLPSDLATDGVHPTQKGYAIMEPLVMEAISNVLDN